MGDEDVRCRWCGRFDPLPDPPPDRERVDELEGLLVVAREVVICCDGYRLEPLNSERLQALLKKLSRMRAIVMRLLR